MDTVGSVLPRTHCFHEKNYIQLLQLQVEGHRHILRTESPKGVSTNQYFKTSLNYYSLVT